MLYNHASYKAVKIVITGSSVAQDRDIKPNAQHHQVNQPPMYMRRQTTNQRTETIKNFGFFLWYHVCQSAGVSLHLAGAIK
jgi:hypothetical protein